jgi:hypothetical protein
MTDANAPDLSIRVTKDGLMTQEFFEFLLQLREPVILGTGTPEGSVTANPGRIYSDTNAAAGGGLYVKETGTGDTGWVLRS